ncbi:amidohydrolase family protein [Streptomyces sp. NPDC057280]|uniref:amidohydrolase family protein n=1 Tax=Streptomyces sp. NPDC057280 TaxID=3346081 RepID=UPI00363F3BF6
MWSGAITSRPGHALFPAHSAGRSDGAWAATGLRRARLAPAGPARRGRNGRPGLGLAHRLLRRPTVPATARAPRGGASVRAGPTGLEALEALEGVTTRAARAAGEAEVTGRIAAGCRADFTARALDPVQGPADELAQAPVLLTVPGGHVVHRTQ